ncbi:MAG: CBS domain-containing protein [Methyloversatilis discipulorum]|uniref:CBS domain-containing protein n=1 Tax=Methyloversatilis discipulorum TaxID=1119528 RepID=UPI0026F0ABA9|nr:CBS domain-containing protein [Methyloversatilis discipulorum]MBV5285612.1 CBS domain-containing protein [Methyloversatilis discipulorum]
MQVREAMTSDVKLVDSHQSIQDAARMMAECNVGSLPVGDNGRLVGMITDRDIAIRAVAAGKSATTEVGQVMSKEVKYCFDDEDVSHVAQNMGDIQLHRLVVLDRDKRLVGIVALADIANCEGAGTAGEMVCGISTPQQSGSHQASSHH